MHGGQQQRDAVEPPKGKEGPFKKQLPGTRQVKRRLGREPTRHEGANLLASDPGDRVPPGGTPFHAPLRYSAMLDSMAHYLALGLIL